MNSHETQNSLGKLDEALDLLNDAAKLKKEEFSRILTDKYSSLKDAVVGSVSGQRDAFEEIRETIEEAIRESEEAVRESADLLDKEVCKNPWPYLGGAAAVALLLGFILGDSKR